MAEYSFQCKIFTITVYVMLESLYQRLMIYHLHKKVRTLNPSKPQAKSLLSLISYYYYYYDYNHSNIEILDAIAFPLENLKDIDIKVLRSIDAMGLRINSRMVYLVYVITKLLVYLDCIVLMSSIPVFASSFCISGIGRRFCIMVLFPWSAIVILAVMMDLGLFVWLTWMQWNIQLSPANWGKRMGYEDGQLVHIQNYTTQDFAEIFNCSSFVPTVLRNVAIRHVITMPLMLFCGCNVIRIGCRLINKRLHDEQVNYYTN